MHLLQSKVEDDPLGVSFHFDVAQELSEGIQLQLDNGVQVMLLLIELGELFLYSRVDLLHNTLDLKVLLFNLKRVICFLYSLNNAGADL